MLNAADIPETVRVDEGSGKLPPHVGIDAAGSHSPSPPG